MKKSRTPGPLSPSTRHQARPTQPAGDGPPGGGFSVHEVGTPFSTLCVCLVYAAYTFGICFCMPGVCGCLAGWLCGLVWCVDVAGCVHEHGCLAGCVYGSLAGSLAHLQTKAIFGRQISISFQRIFGLKICGKIPQNHLKIRRNFCRFQADFRTAKTKTKKPKTQNRHQKAQKRKPKNKTQNPKKRKPKTNVLIKEG